MTDNHRKKRGRKVATTVYLTRDQVAGLKAMTAGSRTPVAEVVRVAIINHLMRSGFAYPALRQERLVRGLTLREIASAVGVSDATLSMWENGNTVPTVDHLVAWHHAVYEPATEVLS